MTSRDSFTKTMITAATAIAISLPLLALADTTDENPKLFEVSKIKQNLVVPNEAEALYARLQDISRQVCGSSQIRMTGSVDRLVENEECYEGTLTDAVERLNDPAVSAIHQE